MELPEAQEHFVELLNRLGGPKKVDQFLRWIQGNWPVETSENYGDYKDELLDEIAADLRSLLPLQVEFQSETIHHPTSGENSDCKPEITVNVDAFLYDDDLVDKLANEGKLPRNYCLRCGSKDTKPLIFISHSASKSVLKHIFRNLLPPLDGRTILDIGFRLGAVLYGAYVYSKASVIAGIELNPDFYNVTSKVVNKYGMASQVQLHLGDVRSFPNIISSADVLILNNVFEFFMTVEQQREIWQYMRQHVRQGSFLVTIPSLENSLRNLNSSINLDDWVEPLQPFSPLMSEDEDMEDELSSVYLYRVK